MEEGTHATIGEVEVKMPVKVDVTKVDGDVTKILINGDPHKQTKEGIKEEYEEEIALDGEFIKVEKESIDLKDSSDLQKTISEVEETSCAVTELDKKIRALEFQVETVAKELQQSESEKSLLKSEVDLTNGKLEKSKKHCEELEANEKNLKKQILEIEWKYNSQLQSLQEALSTIDVHQKEFFDVKEAFSDLSAELESSKKKMEELEVQLVSSAGEVRKFEDLSNEKSSHAELESKRAFEFDKILEAAKLSAKEMEDKTSNLQLELKTLYNKIAENHQIEEALKSTTLELSMVQEKLNFSTSQVTNLEHTLVSRETVIQELTQELNLLKASEEQIKEDVYSLENQEEMKEREAIETTFKNQETQTFTLQEELKEFTGEKETLQNSVTDLSTDLLWTKELCSQLESKLDLAEQNLSRADSLLAQSLSHNAELQVKLNSLEELHQESKNAIETANQRNFELEGLVQASNVTENRVKAQLRETEMHLLSTEKQNTKVEQQLSIAEIKRADTDREIRELRKKIAELTTSLRGIEDESSLSKCHFQAYEERISQLESSLSRSYSRNSQLEQKLKDLADSCAEQEGRASASHHRTLELEDLVHVSHSKAENTGKRTGELELLLEAAGWRIQELEQLLCNTEEKYREVEAESKQHHGRVSEISAELEALQTKSVSLETVLQITNEKERELANMLDIVTEERKKFENMSNTSAAKLLQAENLIEILQNELKFTHEKLEHTGKDLGASVLRENEILQNLKSAEEQLEHHGREVEQAHARSLELETLHASLVKDSEMKLQETAVSFTQKESEAKQLHEKLTSLEEQATFYQDQTIEAAEKVASLKAELYASAIKLASLENTVEEFERRISEMDVIAEKSASEYELLIRTNSKLQEELVAHQFKVSELHGLLSSIQVEKEAATEQLALHVNMISKLTAAHSRGLEIQSEIESRIRETEVQLHEAIEQFTQRDSEARDLSEKLLALETQLELYKEQLSGVTTTAENQKIELEESLIKSQKLEGLIEELQSKAKQSEAENEGLASANLNLSQDLAACEKQMNELQMMLNAVSTEKEDTLAELHASRKTKEELVQQLASDRENLQSQISSAMEENNVLSKMYQDTKNELQAALVQMEEQIVERNAREISYNVDLKQLKAEQNEKLTMQTQISELKEQLMLVETRYKEQMKHGAVRDDSKKDGVEMKSIDFELGASATSKRKSKKRSEGALQTTEAISASSVATATASEPSGTMAFKFILGVAVISMVIGVFLLKKY